jgi:hypothetical protein
MVVSRSEFRQRITKVAFALRSTARCSSTGGPSMSEPIATSVLGVVVMVSSLGVP